MYTHQIIDNWTRTLKIHLSLIWEKPKQIMLYNCKQKYCKLHMSVKNLSEIRTIEIFLLPVVWKTFYWLKKSVQTIIKRKNSWNHKGKNVMELFSKKVAFFLLPLPEIKLSDSFFLARVKNIHGVYWSLFWASPTIHTHN